MIRHGYSLLRMEVCNWGNFQNWQVFDCMADGAGHGGPSAERDRDVKRSAAGPLLASSPNALMAGVNGSGKSTLIDGVIAALLPFEPAVQLGMIHDSDTGPKSGRTIRDYVLGKYASSGGERVMEENRIYSRPAGVSMIVLVFQHNDSGRPVSIGRVWWYDHYKVKEDSAYFLSHERVSIADPSVLNLLDVERGERPYKNAGEFKKGMKTKSGSMMVFDTATDYFQCLHEVFGGIEKDDLKLLNRAFYMKSVGQIDDFVRKYMLVESSHEGIARLLDFSQEAAEISRNIEFCEEKLKQISRIVNSLDAYQKHHEERRALEWKDLLLRIYPTWLDRTGKRRQILEMEKIRAENESLAPPLKSEIESIHQELSRVQSLIARNEIAAVIRNLELEKKRLEEEKTRLKRDRELAWRLCEQAALKPPAGAGDLEVWKKKLGDRAAGLQAERRKLATTRAEFASGADGVQRRSKETREELQFLSEHPTCIPRVVYAIKESCENELGIPRGSLYFVGELIAVNPRAEPFRLAVEAALYPISRNLLCLPEFLDKVTRWLNKTGIQRTLTVKRIAAEELKPATRPEISDSSILSKIEIRTADENPFEYYLWNWLGREYYHRIVSPEEFRKQLDRAVTTEGLVKSDGRTMRKLKRDFEHSLGWNNETRRNELIDRLKDLDAEDRRIKTEVEAVEKMQAESDERLAGLRTLQNLPLDYLNLAVVERREKETAKEIERLQKENIEYDQQCRAEREIQSRLDQKQSEWAKVNAEIAGAVRGIAELGREIDRLTGEVLDFFRHVPAAAERCTSLSRSALGHPWPARDASLDAEDLLEGLRAELSDLNKTSSQYGLDLKKRIRELEHKMESNPVGRYMHDFEQAYHDPNLHYRIEDKERLDDLLAEWRLAQAEIEKTGLPKAKAKWEQFYNNTLVEAIKTAVNEIRFEQNAVKRNIESINQVLKGVDFEQLPTEQRYLQIDYKTAQDDRIKKFQAEMKQVEKTVAAEWRSRDPGESSKQIMQTFMPFVTSLQEDVHYREYVTDVRNHYRFMVRAHRRAPQGDDPVVETFSGSRKDAKSSAQTTQLAYTLLASALACRFHLHDPVKGKNTLRLLILDEFGGKFDNEKPRDIVALLQDMGFQSILVSPMAKADLLAEYIGRLILVHKASDRESKVKSYAIHSREDYERIVRGPALAAAAE